MVVKKGDRRSVDFVILYSEVNSKKENKRPRSESEALPFVSTSRGGCYAVSLAEEREGDLWLLVGLSEDGDARLLDDLVA